MCVKSLEELLEVALGVVRSRGRLGMVLDGENRVLLVLHPFDGAVVEVKVGDLKRFGTWNAARITPNREPVVL